MEDRNMAQPKDFYEFLTEAELPHYYNILKNDLKVSSVSQLKYVEDEDLVEVGMTKPEIRRLRKYFRKECPQGTFGKLRRILKGGDVSSTSSSEKSPEVVKKIPGKNVIPEDSITVLKLLGTGEFGNVQQGVWTTESNKRVQVAIKCLPKNRVESGMTDFLRESTIMHSLEHNNIVRLYGMVLGKQSILLVTELAPLRSLVECLNDPALSSSFSLLQLCDFAQQVAEGMSYLEQRLFVHRDLAARNILVFAKDKVKVSDCGLSRALGLGKEYYQTNFNINLKLPTAWCAPECVNSLIFTSASDVWAFGVTLWEIFSYGFQPWAGLTGDQILNAIDKPNFQRLEKPDLCPTAYYQFMKKCWDHHSERRPMFNEIVTQLPMLKPERFQATRDHLDTESKDYLPYKAMDIITVLDKTCTEAPSSGLWKGVLDSGKMGYFDKSNTAPYTELKQSPNHRKIKISRKESARKSSRNPKSKLTAGMIGRPECDLRHTGHIGYDGAVFGDVSFIGDNYKKLPVKVTTPTHKSNAGSASSLSYIDDMEDIRSQSEVSLASTFTGSVITGLSVGSHEDTLTDVSSMHSDFDGFSLSRAEETTLDRNEKHENNVNEDLDNFKVPDLGFGLSIDLDFGPSFMDEVMKALGSKKDKTPSPNNTDETFPLIEEETSYRPGQTSFDNIALVTENESRPPTNLEPDSAKVREGSNLGSLSSCTSSDATDTQEVAESPREEKKKKNKLKLFIPNRDSNKKERIRTLSASDEKRLDDAIELANEFAHMQTSDHMVASTASLSPGSSDLTERDNQHRSAFSLRKRSPKIEKTFTEEMASVSTEDIVTPEAQEAYNLLVVKGTLKDRTPERRSRKSSDHSDGGSLSSRTSRNINQNIRDPQGIPRCATSPREVAESPEDADTNPLRRLRDSHSFVPKPRLPKSAGSAGHSAPDMTNGWGSNKKQSNSQQPNLNANLSFFAKLKEQEMLNEQDDSEAGECNGEESSVSCSNDAYLQCPHAVVNANVSTNRIPVPPRVPLKPSTLNQKPRQRKYPLDLSSYTHTGHDPRLSDSRLSDPRLSDPRLSDHYSSDGDGSDVTGSSSRVYPLRNPQNSKDLLNASNDSDEVFSSHDVQIPIATVHRLPDVDDAKRIGRLSESPTILNVKGVKVSATDLGYYDTADLFWSEKVNFDELPKPRLHSSNKQNGTGQEPSPIPGTYKTSDNVSYEDLMEFALDGPLNPRASEDVTCDKVRLMRRVLSKDVTIEDCMYALEDTQWDVHSAIKLIKLKQLLCTDLADTESCKGALMSHQWNVQDAANSLLNHHSPSQRSPDLVHV